ncbi:MAG: ABC transporter ATP-binding protein [Clostridia bacterium]|nr:ABC transporter ATP-binding protein [Clostridia bacterium]
MSIIKIENLTKDYGSGRGIFDINLEVNSGEIFGYVGTNGSGKTTTIRNMLGFVYPDSGSIEIDGINPVTHSAELMNKVSYIPGEIAFPNLKSGADFLKLQAEYYGITDFTRMNYIADKLGLDTTADLKRMSKGMKQKTAIVAAFMADRDIMILDEPTTGLDPLMRDVFIELVNEEKKRGKTVFLSGHIFEELEEVCDRVAMLKDGKIIDTVNMYELRHYSDRNFEIEFENEGAATAFKNAFNGAYVRGNCAFVAIPAKRADELFKALQAYNVLQLHEKHTTLEQVFMKDYNQQ